MPTTRITTVSVLALLLIAANPARTGDFDDSAVSKLDYPAWFMEHAYEKDWTYQRFARSKALERLQP
jgi:hypothetical protein